MGSDCAQYLPPVFKASRPDPPQMIASAAAWGEDVELAAAWVST